MEFYTTVQLLKRAQKKRYAVGGFNVHNMESVQAVIKAAEQKKSPAIIQVTESGIKYAGIEYISSIAKARNIKVPMALHLDHGKKIETVKSCIKNGFSSVMIDGSHLKFEQNIKLTKKVVRFCHPKGISVEAELGKIAGIEGIVAAKKSIFTDPDAAKEFVERTDCDTLAVAIGTSHGAYKFKGPSRLDFDRLKKIKSKVKIPLVLHGASGVPAKIKRTAIRYGAKIETAKGVSDSNIRKAISLGVCKVNIDTDSRIAFTGAVRKVIFTKPAVFDPRKILRQGRDAMLNLIKAKMDLFKSSGRV